MYTRVQYSRSALGSGTCRTRKTKMCLPNITNDSNQTLPMLAIKPQSHEWICQQFFIGVDVLASDVGNMQKKTFKMNAVITRIEGIGGPVRRHNILFYVCLFVACTLLYRCGTVPVHVQYLVQYTAKELHALTHSLHTTFNKMNHPPQGCIFKNLKEPLNYE